MSFSGIAERQLGILDLNSAELALGAPKTYCPGTTAQGNLMVNKKGGFMHTSAGLSILITLIVSIAAVAASGQPIDNRDSTAIRCARPSMRQSRPTARRVQPGAARGHM
jgi:hypothetical protein